MHTHTYTELFIKNWIELKTKYLLKRSGMQRAI